MNVIKQLFSYAILLERYNKERIEKKNFLYIYVLILIDKNWNFHGKEPNFKFLTITRRIVVDF